MSTFRHLFFSLLVAAIFVFSADAEECYIAEDMGGSYQVVVKANPVGLRNDSGYTHETISQRADWVDSKVFTNGSSFYFIIEGAWTPWYGNTMNKTDLYGNDVTLLADESDYCILETKNPESPEMGRRGEFDYITSSYNVVDSGSSYTKMYLDPTKQKPCWLTTGEGLYIAFFGKSGVENPTIATHLKTGIITCDGEYLSDKNGDGIFTVDECYDINDKTRKNMAYYSSYRSEHLQGDVSCPDEFFHGSDKHKIGLTECYEDVEMADGSTQRVDRTKFVFQTNYFFKNKDREHVKEGERVKFIIYDRYYRDNVGQYIINMYKGVSDNTDAGLIQRILADMENVFIGKRNDAGKWEGGILVQFYSYIVKDTMFAWTVRMFIIIYMAFLGLQFAMGSLEYKTKELMGILLKLTFILSFTTVTSWEVYDYFIVRFFFDGISSIIIMLVRITNGLFNSAPNFECEGDSLSAVFCFIDRDIMFLFSDAITRKIQGLFFGVWFGFIVIPIFYILVIYFIYQIVNATFPYIIMFIQAVIGLAIGPIFISFYLFKETEDLFKNWLAFIGARFINMAFLFLFIFSFMSIIRERFESLLHFEVCKVPLLQALGDSDGSVSSVLNFFSFGIKVWDARWSEQYPKPTFIGTCIDLLFIVVLIYLFSQIMKKLPSIVDSMIDIGGKEGGGLKLGSSILGKSVPTTFTDALNKIKVTGSDGKPIGLADRINKIGKDAAKKATAEAGSKIWNHTGKAAVDAVKDKKAQNEAKYNAVVDSNLKGKDAVDAAVKQYRDSLSGRGVKGGELDKKVNSFQKSMEKEYVDKPISAEMQRIHHDLASLSAVTKGGLSADTAEKLMNERMNDFFDRELGGNREGRYNKLVESFPVKFEGNEGGPKLNDRQMEAMRRAFSMQQAASRAGLSILDPKTRGNIGGINDYQTQLQRALNEGRSKEQKKNSKAYMMGDKIELGAKKSKDALLKDNQRFTNAYVDSLKKQYNMSLADAKHIADERGALLSKLEQERLAQQKANLDKESARLAKLKESEAYKKDAKARELIDKQAAELEKRKKADEELSKLKAQRDKGSEEEKKKLDAQIKELEKNRPDYDALIKGSDEINGVLKSASPKDLEKISDSLNNELKDKSLITVEQAAFDKLDTEEKELAKDLEDLRAEMQSAVTLTQNENGTYVVEPVNENLVLAGINAEEFGVQGVKGLGLGEDVDDVMGFGKGAGAAILGSDFEGTSESESKVDENTANILKARLKMAKQQSKILEFQLAQAQAAKDEKAIASLEEQIKESQKEIKTIQNDVDDS